MRSLARELLTSLAILSSASSLALAASPDLVAAAVKEGSVTWYTTQIVDQLARPAADAFTKKYGIKVAFVRADSSTLVLRLTNEAQAGHIQADVVDSTMGSLALKKRGILQKWLPDNASTAPKQFIDGEGYWEAASANVLTIGYNTNLVSKEDAPRRFADLLDKKWTDKLVWGSTASPSAGPGFVGTVFAAMGEAAGMDYLKKLSAQKVVGLQESAREVMNQIMTGEYPVGIQLFNNHAVISAKTGAPVAWAPLEASMAHLLVVSVTAGAPHPNAGKLFEDFLTSKDGQAIFRNADYLTVDPQVPPKDPSLALDEKNFHAIYFTPEELELGMPKWIDVYKTLFK